MKTIPPPIDMEAALREQAATEASVRFNQGWLSFDGPPPPGSEAQIPQSFYKGNGGEMTQGPGGIYGTGMDYGSVRQEMVSADRVPEPIPAHPFKLSWNTSGSNIRLWVQYGLVDVPLIVEDSPGSWIVTSLPRSPFMSNGSDLLLGDPVDTGGTSAGFETLAPSTAYGVWVKVTADTKIVDVVGQLSDGKGIGPSKGQWYDDALITPYGSSGAASSIATIHTDSSYTNPGDAPALVANNTGFSYYYIGKVTTDASGVTSILQYRKSDLVVPPVMLPLNFAISSDANNDLLDGIDTGDGRVFYEDP